MLVFHGNQPCLEISEPFPTPGPNFGRTYGVNRDRFPDRDWGELHNTLIDSQYCKDVPETDELRQILLEDLAYAYGSDTKKFSAKLKEFNFI